MDICSTNFIKYRNNSYFFIETYENLLYFEFQICLGFFFWPQQLLSVILYPRIKWAADRVKWAVVYFSLLHLFLLSPYNSWQLFLNFLLMLQHGNAKLVPGIHCNKKNVFMKIRQQPILPPTPLRRMFNFKRLENWRPILKT